ncbi:hypothetical protein OIU84_006470 [Salix udensis]|uniref:PGG domain-containing protein n=1 Tax=Salix udensis TaxID=889485 RepID=A0AAD6JYH5_9ROSI|nr:hypothetical protein OIU84_006470 [Salix udensis]
MESSSGLPSSMTQKKMTKQLTRKKDDTPLLFAARAGDLDAVMEILTGTREEELKGLLEKQNQSGETALYVAVQYGNVGVVREMIKYYDLAGAGIKARNGFDAFHVAAKRGDLEILRVLMEVHPELSMTAAASQPLLKSNGKTALHSAARNGHVEVVRALLTIERGIATRKDKKGQTALHMAVKGQNVVVVEELIHAEPSSINMVDTKGQLSLTYSNQERKNSDCHAATPAWTRVETDKGLNNAINSTTVVGVLIATVTFAAIFTVPGQYVDDPAEIPPGQALGEANIAPRAPFIIFFLFDSIALFISLAVVVVQTSVVVIENRAKKQLMSIINKLMWIACALVSVAFLALSYIVVGEHEKWLAVGVTIIGATIMVTTLGTMCYWVVKHRIESSSMRSIRRSSLGSRSRSFSVSLMSDSEMLNSEHNRMYAI